MYSNFQLTTNVIEFLHWNVSRTFDSWFCSHLRPALSLKVSQRFAVGSCTLLISRTAREFTEVETYHFTFADTAISGHRFKGQMKYFHKTAKHTTISQIQSAECCRLIGWRKDSYAANDYLWADFFNRTCVLKMTRIWSWKPPFFHHFLSLLFCFMDLFH